MEEAATRLKNDIIYYCYDKLVVLCKVLSRDLKDHVWCKSTAIGLLKLKLTVISRTHNNGCHNFVYKAGNEFGRVTTRREGRSAWVARFVKFRKKVNTQSSSCCDDEISSSSRQFLSDYKVVTSSLHNLLVSGSEIFIDLSVKRGVRKFPQTFLLVEVGPPNNQSAAFVGRFDNWVSVLTKIVEVYGS